MEMTQRTASGFEHGLINTIANSVPFDPEFKKFDEKTREELKKKRKEDEKLVKARYLNSRGANERLERPYCQASGGPITQWVFLHDHVYTIPKGLFDDVNAQAPLAQRSDLCDVNGKPIPKEGSGEKIHRFFRED
ncbi:MAG TPA: hypothetical protein DCP92_24640 [Nitrospiraceae bacterium]|jgi:hypothetical protein|nr:hypothetical protein [Nitrospiraceae bacterium]